MCHKCNWIEVDGIQAHVNGDIKDPETLDALKTLIKVAYNYEKMKRLATSPEPPLPQTKQEPQQESND